MITDTPVFVYVQQHDAHLCYWSGVPMTRKHAHRWICENWLNLYQAKHVYEEIDAEYSRLKKISILPFANSEHSDYIRVSACFVSRFAGSPIDFSVLTSLVEKYSPQTALSWLLQDVELVL